MKRRSLLVGTAALAADALFCAPRPSSAQGTTPSPVSVEHLYGKTYIAAPPRRIVCLGLNDQDFAYALGVAPVGVTEWWGDKPYATWGWAEAERARLGATPDIGGARFLDYEWILALEPDLILATYRDIDARAYRKLSRIAPVVAPPRGYTAWTAPWENQLALIASALDKSPEAVELLKAIAIKMDEARRALRQFSGKTAAIADFREGQFVLWDSKSAPMRFVQQLGFGFSPVLEALANSAGWIYLSIEQVHMLDVDLLIWPSDVRVRVEDLAMFRSLPAARKQANIWLADADPLASAALWFQSPLSIRYLLDNLPRVVRC